MTHVRKSFAGEIELGKIAAKVSLFFILFENDEYVIIYIVPTIYICVYISRL